mgnify:CR=1 FL=1
MEFNKQNIQSKVTTATTQDYQVIATGVNTPGCVATGIVQVPGSGGTWDFTAIAPYPAQFLMERGRSKIINHHSSALLCRAPGPSVRKYFLECLPCCVARLRSWFFRPGDQQGGRQLRRPHQVELPRAFLHFRPGPDVDARYGGDHGILRG